MTALRAHSAARVVSNTSGYSVLLVVSTPTRLPARLISIDPVVKYILCGISDDRVRPAFLNACSAHPTTTDLLFHSDRGHQYARASFRQTLSEHGFVPSMSRIGNCWDNAVAESFFATFKNEEASRV
jgi:hypothetical protein